MSLVILVEGRGKAASLYTSRFLPALHTHTAKTSIESIKCLQILSCKVHGPNLPGTWQATAKHSDGTVLKVAIMNKVCIFACLLAMACVSTSLIVIYNVIR
jgi:hypothetical protein